MYLSSENLNFFLETNIGIYPTSMIDSILYIQMERYSLDCDHIVTIRKSNESFSVFRSSY